MLKLILIKEKLRGISFKKLIPVIVLIFLLFPLFSEGAIGTGLFDLFSAMLEGISEIVAPFKSFYVIIILSLLVSGMALHTVLWLLSTATDPSNLTIAESQFVQVGWQFTSSLANTAIIVVLVVIGIATILGKEGYGAKKALPKLILIALLVNFSLVFVGAIVDISNIILNTFLTVDVGGELTEAIFESWSSIVTLNLAYLGSLTAGLMIPFVAPIFQIAFVGALTGVFLPSIIQAIMQVITTIIIAGTLLSYALLFYARIFIIQILAILSPLAFISWILPKTKDLWNKWLKALIGWSFLGVVLYFFLLLSSIATAPLRPTVEISSPFTSYSNIPSLFMYYLTLSFFLIISITLSKKFMPEGASAIISGAKSAVTGLAGSPLATNIKDRIGHKIASASTQDSIEGEKGKAEEEKMKMKQAAGFKKVGHALKAGWHRSSGSARESAGIATKYTGKGETPEAIKEDIEKRTTDKMVKGKSIKSKVSKMNERLAPDYVKEKMAKDIVESGDLSDKEIIDLIESKKTPPQAAKSLIEGMEKKRPDLHILKERHVNQKKEWDAAKNTIEGMEKKKEKGEDLTVKEKKSLREAKESKQKITNEGIKKMEESVDKMSGNDVKDIKFNDLFKELDDVGESAKTDVLVKITEDNSKLQSLSSADLATKNSFISFFEKNANEKSMENFGKFLTKPKNKEKWSEDQLNIVRSVAKDHFSEKEEGGEKEEKPKEDQKETAEEINKRIQKLHGEKIITDDSEKIKEIEESIKKLEKDLRENY